MKYKNFIEEMEEKEARRTIKKLCVWPVSFVLGVAGTVLLIVAGNWPIEAYMPTEMARMMHQGEMAHYIELARQRKWMAYGISVPLFLLGWVFPYVVLLAGIAWIGLWGVLIIGGFGPLLPVVIVVLLVYLLNTGYYWIAGLLVLLGVIGTLGAMRRS